MYYAGEEVISSPVFILIVDFLCFKIRNTTTFVTEIISQSFHISDY